MQGENENLRDRTDVPTLLTRIADPRQPADERLVNEVYAELRRLAELWMRDEKAGHTLQPTALVSEAWLRLVGHDAAVGWEGRSHFVAVAARTMRRLLVDHARKKAADKRGGGWARLTLSAADGENVDRPEQFEALDEALTELAELDPRAAQVIELRFFGGFGMEEIAQHLGVSRRTVQDDWAMARAWLHGRLR